MTDGDTERPRPIPDAASAPYWDAAAHGVLALARCEGCERFAHPPGPVCPHCLDTSAGVHFEPVVGSGTIRSWTTVRQSSLGGFDDEVPFTLVDVQLDGAEDVRIIGRLVDGPDAELVLGSRVWLAFEELTDDISVPAFTLEAS